MSKVIIAFSRSAQKTRRKVRQARAEAKALGGQRDAAVEAEARDLIQARARWLEEPIFRLLATPMPRWSLRVIDFALIVLAFVCLAGVVTAASAEQWGAATTCGAVAVALWLVYLVTGNWR